MHRSFPSSFFNSILVSECEVNLIDGYPFPILQSYKHCLLNISFFAVPYSCTDTPCTAYYEKLISEETRYRSLDNGILVHSASIFNRMCRCLFL